MMLPEKFLSRIREQNYLEAVSLEKALGEPSPVSIMVNRGKWDRIPVRSKQVPWCKTGYYLESRPSFTLDPLFHSGCYYPREASGMFMDEIFRQLLSDCNGPRVLDLCAAPGGKSIQLSDLIGQEGLLVANEVIRSRASVLSETITKWGMGNSIVTQNDPSVFNGLKGYFDIVFVDAPCSGEGMFRDKIAVDEWSAENAAHCAERQKRIISDVWPALKENGLLVYSTCTFNPAENEDNIKWLLSKNKGECERLDVSAFKGINEIDNEGILGYGFYPDKIKGEGFFISVVRKKENEEAGIRRKRMNKEMRPSRNELENADRWMEVTEAGLMKRGEALYSIPCDMEEFNFLAANLNVIKGGDRIFMNKNNDLVPSHELALSQKLKKNAFPRTELELQDAISFLRRDNIIPDKVLPEGWNILTYKDVNLGFVKNIGKRINNYFPVEWRVRMNRPEPGKENIIRWEQPAQDNYV